MNASPCSAATGTSTQGCGTPDGQPGEVCRRSSGLDRYRRRPGIECVVTGYHLVDRGTVGNRSSQGSDRVERRRQRIHARATEPGRGSPSGRRRHTVLLAHERILRCRYRAQPGRVQLRLPRRSLPSSHRATGSHPRGPHRAEPMVLAREPEGVFVEARSTDHNGSGSLQALDAWRGRVGGNGGALDPLVLGRPSWSMRSFNATGTPARGSRVLAAPNSIVDGPRSCERTVDVDARKTRSASAVPAQLARGRQV